MAICQAEAHRGLVVQAGGVKVIIINIINNNIVIIITITFIIIYVFIVSILFLLLSSSPPPLQTLLSLCNDGTDAGKVKASHALAKLAVSQDPNIAFAGQRVGRGFSF